MTEEIDLSARLDAIEFAVVALTEQILARRAADFSIKEEFGHDADGYRPTPYHADADETVTCPKCDKKNSPDAAYCDQCGKQLAGDDEVTVS